MLRGLKCDGPVESKRSFRDPAMATSDFVGVRISINRSWLCGWMTLIQYKAVKRQYLNKRRDIYRGHCVVLCSFLRAHFKFYWKFIYWIQSFMLWHDHLTRRCFVKHISVNQFNEPLPWIWWFSIQPTNKFPFNLIWFNQCKVHFCERQAAVPAYSKAKYQSVRRYQSFQ